MVNRPFMPFQPTGCDGGLVQFWTDSWTGASGGYEVTFDINRATVDCSCLDATCRKKNYKPIGDKGTCKHARLASELLWPVIAKALGLALLVFLCSGCGEFPLSTDFPYETTPVCDDQLSVARDGADNIGRDDACPLPSKPLSKAPALSSSKEPE